MPDQDNKNQSGQSTDQSKVKIKVDGQELEVTQSELIELAQKGRDYTKKTQALSEKEKSLDTEKTRVEALAKIVDEMEANPDLKEALNKTYNDVKAGKLSREKADSRSLKLLDKKIDQALTAEERESLMQVRTIITEETAEHKAKIDEINTQIAKLREDLTGIATSTLAVRNEKINEDIDRLKAYYGDDVVTKYADEIRRTAITNPKAEVNRIFRLIASDEEIKSSLLKQVEKEKKEELERKKRGTLPSGEGGLSGEKITPKLTKWGVPDKQDLMDKIKEKIGLGK